MLLRHVVANIEASQQRIRNGRLGTYAEVKCRIAIAAHRVADYAETPAAEHRKRRNSPERKLSNQLAPHGPRICALIVFIRLRKADHVLELATHVLDGEIREANPQFGRRGQVLMLRGLRLKI